MTSHKEGFVEALQAEIGEADSLLRSYEAQLKETGFEPDYTYIGDPSTHKYLPQWEGPTELSGLSERELGDMLADRYFQVANLSTQITTTGEIAVAGSGKVFEPQHIAPETRLSPAYAEFMDKYSGFTMSLAVSGEGEYQRTPAYFSGLHDAVGKNFFATWMKSQHQLPDFTDAPVKDAKPMAARGKRQGNADMAELKSSLPDGVSVKQSGYGGRYSR